MQQLAAEIAWTCAWCADPIRTAPRTCPAGCGARVHAACASRARPCTTPGCGGEAPSAPAGLHLQPRESPDARCAWCHDALGLDGRGCPDCGATAHPDCAAEYGGCPTLGCSAHAAPRARRVQVAGPQVHVGEARPAGEVLAWRARRRRRAVRRQQLGAVAAVALVLGLYWVGFDALAAGVGVLTAVLIALFPRLLRGAEARTPRPQDDPPPALGVEGWAAGGAIGFAAGVGLTLACVAVLAAGG